MDYKKKSLLSWQNCEIGSRIVSVVADQSAKYINHNLQSMLHFSPAFIYFISQLLYISKLRVYYQKNRGKIFQLCKEWQCKNWCGLSARTWGGESSKNILVHTIKIKWNINNSSPWHWNVLNWAWIDYCYKQKAFMCII